MAAVEEISFEANGLHFGALAAGPASGPLVVLLHGFPELSRSWLHQLPALADAGYRAVAPDLRGYGKTDKQGPYDIWTLARDVREIIHAQGRQNAVVVGHDWGGGVAYATAMFEPDCVERLVVLNCPHPQLMGDTLLRSPRQLARSWYMFFFQIPGLPEWLLSQGHAVRIARALRGGSTVKDAWTREELAHYQDAFSAPANLTGPIGYYRGAFRSFFKMRKERDRRIRASTLILWGVEDRFLGKELLEPARMAPFWEDGRAPEVRLIEGAGHFVQNEAPDRVNAGLLSWLGSAQPAAATNFS
jgi:pimeloyl-ACP methyl ester carboxylesterase